MNNLLKICILLVLFAAAVSLCMFFSGRARQAFKIKVKVGFSTVSALQQAYSKGKKENPSIILLGVADGENNSPDSGRALVRSCVKLEALRLFCGNDYMAAPYMNGGYLILSHRDGASVKKRADVFMENYRRFLNENGIFTDISVNFGAYITPSGEVSFDEAVDRARLAYREAARSGKDYAVWSYDLHNKIQEKDSLKKTIQRDVENNNFFLEWQPVIDIATGAIANIEVLSRLNANSRGVVPPGSFIPVVSEVGICSQFDYYIFDKSCKWLSGRINKGLTCPGISVNFFRTSICSEGFTETIIGIIKKYDIPPGKIRIEVLEESIKTKEEDDIIIKNLKALRKEGMLILLDDFGAGCSSFSDIQHYPIDIVKIDRSIILNANTPVGLTIFKNILNIAREVGASVICEGIDDDEHLSIIKESGCRLVQGFYFYAPMSLTALERLLDEKPVQTMTEHSRV